jgi:hypothetical protein
MVDKIEEIEPHIERCSQEYATLGREWGAAPAAGWRYVFRQMNGIHATTRQRLVRILHQPEAVVAIHNHVC